MTSEFTLSDMSSYYALDASLVADGEELRLVGRATPRWGMSQSEVMIDRALMPAERLQLAQWFKTERFALPGAKGVYCGEAQMPITRVVMFVTEPYEAVLHIRCTPLTPFLRTISETLESVVNDVMKASAMDALNVIIAGRSGAGKTRFMVNYVLPHYFMVAGRLVYVETIPEIRQYLQNLLPRSAALCVSVMEPGLVGRVDNDQLTRAIVYARTTAVGCIFFQELQVGESFVNERQVQEVISSGVPVVLTSHQSARDPVQTAAWYRSRLGAYIGRTIVVVLLPDGVHMVYVDSDTMVHILDAVGGELRYNVVAGLPSTLWKTLLLLSK